MHSLIRGSGKVFLITAFFKRCYSIQNQNDPSYFGTNIRSEAQSNVAGSMVSVFSCFWISSSLGLRVSGPAQKGVARKELPRWFKKCDDQRHWCVWVFCSTYPQKVQARSWCCRGILRLRLGTLVLEFWLGLINEPRYGFRDFSIRLTFSLSSVPWPTQVLVVSLLQRLLRFQKLFSVIW